MDKQDSRMEDISEGTSCGSCRFFVRHEYDNLDVIADYGQCRRFPPRRVAENMSAFPIVTDECFCGEWEEKM